MRRTIASVYRYNFKHYFYYHLNPQRIYSLCDEKGYCCAAGRRVTVRPPFVYSDEVWTRIEYQVAADLIYEGLIEEGLRWPRPCVTATTGSGNPWNEVECGSHYARLTLN